MIHKKHHLERSVKYFLLEGLNWFHGANLTLNSDVTFKKVTQHNTHDSQEVSLSYQVISRLQGTDTIPQHIPTQA